MQQQLLWIEIVTKLAAGLPLLFVPRTLGRLFGLPFGDDAFWPRLVGGGLVAVAFASVLEAYYTPGKGLGLMGSVAINLTMAAVLGGLLILGRATGPKRGRLLLWLSAAALTLLALITIVSTR